MSGYVVITPAKNEAQYISITLQSMINQSIKPRRWIIVDDGSIDETFNIASELSKCYNWITVVRNNSLEKRSSGGNVVRAFNDGLRYLQEDYDFIVKLDADLQFNEHYFEELIRQFMLNEKLGISGGYCINSANGSKIKIDNTPEYHVRGATKMYRKKCFDDIGGLMPIFGWDGIDEIKAMMLGWETKSFKAITIVHLRPTGQETGVMRYAWRRGMLNYYLGYNPFYLVLSCVNNFKNKPFILFGLSLFAGYVYSYITHKDQITDKNFTSFLKQFQKQRLKLIKRK
jgi:poly-beta-1,6-N-acetyl-D-glucosamine synthase